MRHITGFLIALLAAITFVTVANRPAQAQRAILGNGTVAVISGQYTTVAASDTVSTGLVKVTSVACSLESDPGDDPEWVTCAIGDQAGTPAAGSILIKTWKNTGGTDPTPLAATTFTKKVNWIAFGT
jgi:hypothetical protein